MKKLALLYYGAGFLMLVPEEYWVPAPELEPLRAFFHKLGLGEVSLEDPKARLTMGLVLLTEALKED